MMHVLMRKNTPVAMVNIDASGALNFQGKILELDLLPMQGRAHSSSLRSWWADRSIPIGQGKTQEMLKKKGIETAGLYLAQNLGLSLTDCYWVKPAGSELIWEDVNLYTNDFKRNLLLGEVGSPGGDALERYSPNSSLQGNLEKTWSIIGGERFLVKGNHSELSSESINEILYSYAAKRQGMPHAEYFLLQIKGKPYDFGVKSPLFTSQEKELVSAYAVTTSEIKPNHLSTYDHFVNVAVQNGLDRDATVKFLDAEAELDFVFSNRDRHLTNLAVLRDTETLNFVSMAPVFDSGKSLGVGKEIVPLSAKRLLREETIGFKRNALDTLLLVKDKDALDISKLPAPGLVEEAYFADSKVTSARVDFAVEMYERKIDLLSKFQSGKDLKAEIGAESVRVPSGLPEVLGKVEEL